MAEYYFQYQIKRDRPGLLGDISSLLGMLGVNIVQLSGVSEFGRGFLIRVDRPDILDVLTTMLHSMEDIEVTALREPTLRDRLALRHGRFIERSDTEKRTYRFVRDELGVLVDFLGELLKRPGKQVIGVRGQPRVGKTEAVVAASVYANKRWLFVSSTLLKQTIMRELPSNEFLSDQFVYIIDGAVSVLRGGEDHLQCVDEILRMKAPIVIEHPDVFVKRSRYTWDLFDLIIELRREPQEELRYDMVEDDPSTWTNQ
ncbi:amino acid-binding ACT domain-containing protein [Alicyclobacillus hesperidum URH17-3-68]|uniref:DUF3388 domain-containing protein n=1 Tax=Alicyclobacillus hesperidum TaxID=89784 RepID=A0A1H2SKE0_9BACL|nr:DUF3388 domain-containing protein [Alicyclobacillus hesperidum]KRW91609.1 hypothetical protein SD51_08155 [Alicyclobacillus tengchongensis]EJY55196.1 amino acid-binding ACT domain-containing protein [Alicyclobacillus hesperidum URH17-3-68]SDW32163.1 Protein of unknown function [Alicyclobacillus hesperidum]GLG00626.1 hypothetical protein Alches_06650 [Alicyclobacillus hesperidum subsp. aegles]GLV12426.1 hypothetical protein Heshes_01100 [Alicyclobacillus hesperidum]